jgi:D-serine deaminase-like pyridoxal phosphate-dependent protein
MICREPALLVDMDAFEANVKKMAAFTKSRGRALRPHGKTHKCPEIARRADPGGRRRVLARAKG